MELSDLSKVQVEKLNTSNYYVWSNIIEVYLRGRGLWAYVDGTTVAPAAGTALADFNRKCDQANSIILLSIQKECLAPVISMREPDKVWTTLKNMFESSSQANVDGLLVTYQEITMHTEETVMQYVNRLVEMENKITSAGHTLSEADKKRVLLRGLRSEFAVIAGVARATDKTVQEAIGLLVVEEAQGGLAVKSEVKTENAFFSKKPKKTCKFCKKTGHDAKRCWLNPNGNNYRPNLKKEEKIADNAYVSFVAEVAKEKDHNTKCEKWYIDSGASTHMCHKEEDFTELKKNDCNGTVSIGDGTAIPVKGVGTIKVMSVVNGKKVAVHLKDVLYVPNLSCNLISVTRCRKMDMRVTFDSDRNGRGICTGQKRSSGNTVLIGIENKESGLFEALLKPEMDNHKCSLASISDDVLLWHARLGHASSSTISKTIPIVKGIDLTNSKMNVKCPVCTTFKSKRKSRSSKPEDEKEKTEVLALLHCDIQGPITNPSQSGFRYFVPLLDDASGLSMITMVKRKSEVAKVVKDMIQKMERLTGKVVKRLRSDNASELLSTSFKQWISEKGITQELSPPYSPESNGKAERVQQTIMSITRCLLDMIKHIPGHTQFWPEAVHTANFIRNRMYTASCNDPTKTPYEMFGGSKPDLSILRAFGAEAYVHIPKVKRKGKFSKRAEKGYLVGYSPGDAYRVAIRKGSSWSIVTSKDVDFDESRQTNTSSHNFQDTEKVGENETLVEDTVITEESAEQTENVTVNSPQEDSVGEPNLEDAPEDEQGNPISDTDAVTYVPNLRRSMRASKPPERFDSLLVQHCLVGRAEDPMTVQEAFESNEAHHWRQAMNDEIAMIRKLKAWVPAFLPKGKKAIKSKWVFSRKYDAQGNVTRYRARLCPKGFTQVPGVDFTDVFAPVLRYTTLRTLMALKAVKKYHMKQVDVINAFLNGSLDEELFLELPEGVEINKQHGDCFLLLKAMNGLKQAARAWYKKLDKCLTRLGFKQSESDPSLYVQREEQNVIFALVYVDDILFIGSHEDRIEQTVKQLQEHFQIRVEDKVENFLGILINCHMNGDVHLHSAPAIERVLRQFNFENCRPSGTPLPAGTVLTSEFCASDDNERAKMSLLPYRELVGSLLYLANTTRPDISFAVGMLSRYMENPGVSHWESACHVLRYLKATRNTGILYKSSSTPHIDAYSDADFAVDRDTRKSTSGFVFTCANGAISWRSKKQTLTAQSTVEAETIALSNAVRELLWIKKLLRDLDLSTSFASEIYVDNQGCISVCKSGALTDKTKHIGVKLALIRDHIENEDMKLTYKSTSEMAADMFTKQLPRVKLNENLRQIGLINQKQ